MTNTCKTCRFYDEMSPREKWEGGAEEYALGLCTIKRDRLPLWAKDCACDTYVHDDWENCPTWTAPGSENIPVVEMGPQIAPRWLPVGAVICGSSLLADQFPAVLEFAKRHVSLLDAEAVRRAAIHWESEFDDCDLSAEAYNDLCDALQSACPPFCFFGSSEANGSDIGVWPNDDEIEEAIYKNGTGRMCRVGLDLEISVASEAFDWIIVINDDGSYRELYECNKGVKSLVWKI